MAWSRIQSAGGTSGTATGSFGVAYTTANLSSGSKLIAVSGIFAFTTTAVKDGAGNSFTKIASIGYNGSTANGEVSLWAMDTPAGDVGAKPTITATYSSGSGQFCSLVIQEVSGLAVGNTLAAMIDGTAATNSGTISANGNATCGAYSSAAANEYLAAIYSDDENNTFAAIGTPTGSAAYTLDPNGQQGSSTHNCVVPAYGNSTNGAETATFGITATWAGANNWATILVAFKLAGAVASAATPAALVSVPPPLVPPAPSPLLFRGSLADTPVLTTRPALVAVPPLPVITLPVTALSAGSPTAAPPPATATPGPLVAVPPLPVITPTLTALLSRSSLADIPVLTTRPAVVVVPPLPVITLPIVTMSQGSPTATPAPPIFIPPPPVGGGMSMWKRSMMIADL